MKKNNNTNLIIGVKSKLIFKQRIMIFDVDNIILSLLDSKNIYYKIHDAYVADNMPYQVLFLDVKKIQMNKIIKTINEYAVIEMSLRGYTDYRDFCETFSIRMQNSISKEND